MCNNFGPVLLSFTCLKLVFVPRPGCIDKLEYLDLANFYFEDKLRKFKSSYLESREISVAWGIESAD